MDVRSFKSINDNIVNNSKYVTDKKNKRFIELFKPFRPRKPGLL